MKNYQNFLLEQLNERKRRNSQFSLRSFAKVLDISPAQLSGLINGKKNLSLKQAAKIIHKLDLAEETSADIFKDLFPPSLKKRKIQEERELSEDEFKLISDWTHFAILGLCHLKKNQAHSKWIGNKLAIDPFLALEAFQRLERMGLLKIVNGQFRQTGKRLTTTTEIPSATIRSYHKKNLQMASDKLDTVAISDREFLSITMAVNPLKILKAKKMMNDFKNKLHQVLEDDNTSEVFTFSMQLFPLTQKDLL